MTRPYIPMRPVAPQDALDQPLGPDRYVLEKPLSCDPPVFLRILDANFPVAVDYVFRTNALLTIAA